METGEVWKYRIRSRVYRTGWGLEPRVFTLMRLVEGKGPLSAVCKGMRTAYSKAWKIAKAAEADLGFALMEESSGGESGGETALTGKGKDFLKWYLRFGAEVQQKVDEAFERYFGAGKDRR